MAEKHPCEGCYYFGGRWEVTKCCNYFLITGERRPCQSGEACIVRKDGERSARRAMTVKTKNQREKTNNTGFSWENCLE